jgi:hypothetical protein
MVVMRVEDRHEEHACEESKAPHGVQKSFLTGARGRVEQPHFGKLAYLILGQAEPDAIFDIPHGTYWYGDSLLAPKVPFVEEDVGDAMIARLDH